MDEASDDLRRRLIECADMLRTANHLDPAAQMAAAELMAELASCADLTATNETAQSLAETSDQLVRAIHDPENEGVLTTARSRLEEAAARAETEAPVMTGVVRRLVDALANIGV